MATGQAVVHVVFPILHKLFADHETLNVETATLVATEKPSGRNHAWFIFLGPVRVVHFGDLPEAPSAGLLLRTLVNEITGVATRSLPFWIDAYVGMQQSGEVASDCRLVNEPWAVGTARLKTEARKIMKRGKGFVSYRQFLFFQPETARMLTEVPPLPSRPPWWKRIFGVTLLLALLGFACAGARRPADCEARLLLDGALERHLASIDEIKPRSLAIMEFDTLPEGAKAGVLEEVDRDVARLSSKQLPADEVWYYRAEKCQHCGWYIEEYILVRGCRIVDEITIRDDM